MVRLVLSHHGHLVCPQDPQEECCHQRLLLVLLAAYLEPESVAAQMLAGVCLSHLFHLVYPLEDTGCWCWCRCQQLRVVFVGVLEPNSVWVGPVDNHVEHFREGTSCRFDLLLLEAVLRSAVCLKVKFGYSHPGFVVGRPAQNPVLSGLEARSVHLVAAAALVHRWKLMDHAVALDQPVNCQHLACVPMFYDQLAARTRTRVLLEA